jgi:hypothetical protein
MSQLQIEVDADLLARVADRAMREGTSVEALLGRFMREYAPDEDSGAHGLRTFAEWARRSQSGSPTGKRSWTRDEIHERRAG